jgi:predicted aldo/keto reductase-like oxidoreductase
MPCPSGVWIPYNLDLYNRVIVHNLLDEARKSYAQPRRPGQDSRAAACTECRQCEDLCPQHIPISDWMRKIHAVLAEGEAPNYELKSE